VYLLAGWCVQCIVLPNPTPVVDTADVISKVTSPSAAGRLVDGVPASGSAFFSAVEFDPETASLLESYEEPTNKKSRKESEGDTCERYPCRAAPLRSLETLTRHT
jgi:hypothetical protein